jgi:TatD DNase family protein
MENLDKAMELGLYIGVNGIVTFTKDQSQLEMYKNIPLSRLLLETDAPFLTPSPYRGTICEPYHISVVAKFLSELRGEDINDLARATTENAGKLLGIT